MAVHPLKHPKTINGQRYEALTLQRPDAGAIRYLDKSGALDMILSMRGEDGAAGGRLPVGLFDKMVPFFARLAGVDEAVIDALDYEDFMALLDKVDEVMPSGPLSGAPTTT